MTNAAPGWYPDPTQPATQRYWDGVTWTEQRAPLAPVVQVQIERVPGNGYAVTALIFGLLTIVPTITLIGLIVAWIPGIPGVIFGVLGVFRAKGIGDHRIGMALWGLCLSASPFILLILGSVLSLFSGD